MGKKLADSSVELKDLDVKELQARLKDLKSSYFRAKFRHAASPLKNPMHLRAERRGIARIQTFLRQKEARV